MSKKIILIAIVVLVLIVVIGFSIYFLLNNQGNSKKLPPNQSSVPSQLAKTANKNILPVMTQAQTAVQVKKDYPEDIKGVINFLDTKDSYNTTLKADDGKVYTLWPPQPQAVYESSGAKNGERVEVQGKLTKDGNLEWGSMKPI